MAGDGQSFIRSKLYFREIVLLIFHFAILLLTIERFFKKWEGAVL